MRDILPGAEIRIENSSRFDLVEWADVVILGPGGLIDDVVTENVDNYLRFLRRSQERGIVNMMVGVGVQRLRTAVGKKICKDVLSKADYVSVRSPGDAKLLADIGVRSHVFALQDMAFLLHDKSLRRKLRNSISAKSFITNRLSDVLYRPRLRPTLGFSLMNWDFTHVDRNKIQPDMVQVADQYTEYIMENFSVLKRLFDVYLICQSGDDIALYERIADRYKVRIIPLHELELDQSIALYDAYSKLDFVMTGRFHGLIMAALAQRPLMNISIGNHKQAKLISQDLPSLAPVNFRLEQLYGEDLFTKFIDMAQAHTLPKADSREIARCAQLARMNRDLMDYFVGRSGKQDDAAGMAAVPAAA